MDPVLLIVSGPPASGKTVLARRLAADLALPLITKDDIKERLFDLLGWHDREWSKKLGRATYGLLYYFVESQLAAGQSVAVESNFDGAAATPEFLAIRARFPYRPVRIQCWGEGEVLLRRFERRDELGERHPGHVDRTAIEDVRAVLLRGRVDPLQIGGPLIEVDTTDFGAVDYVGVLDQVRAALEQNP